MLNASLLDSIVSPNASPTTWLLALRLESFIARPQMFIGSLSADYPVKESSIKWLTFWESRQAVEVAG